MKLAIYTLAGVLALTASAAPLPTEKVDAADL